MSIGIAPPTVATRSEAHAPRRKRPHLHQIDLFRILTFACVIGAHVVGNSIDAGNTAANGVVMPLHFTRDAFFALTGFVLIYQYRGKSLDTRAFWRKRFPLVGIPYLAWSVIYWGYSVLAGLHAGEPIRSALWRLVFETATGGAWYQLYFLLVTMQAYLLFPLILRLLRATEGNHKWVLAASVTLQLGVLWLLVHPPALTGRPLGIWNHLYATAIPYQFYILLGATAAWHIDAVTRTVRRLGPLLVAGAIVGLALAELYFLRQTRQMPAWQANNVFMPHLLFCYVLIIFAVYTVSSWWAAHRREHDLFSRAVRFGSDRSFGIFLSHPIALQVLAPVIPALQNHLGLFWGTMLLYLTVVAMAIGITEVAHRIPGSLWLTGRPMLHTDPLGIAGHLRRAQPSGSAPAAEDLPLTPTR